MIIKVKLFAMAKEKANADSIEIEVPEGATLALLRDEMDSAYPALQGLPGRWAVNLELSPILRKVNPGDEVAWIPPVSGG